MAKRCWICWSRQRSKCARNKPASLQAQVALTESQSEAELAQSDLAVAGAQLESDEAELKQSDEANKRRVAWVAALDGSLATMKTDATNALSVTKPEGAAFKQARKRIGDDIPATLLTRVEERRAAEVARIASKSVERSALTDAVEVELDLNGGLAGRAVDKWAAFQRQEAVVGEYVNTARNRFDQALATLTLVGDATRSALTLEEDASIDDPALATPRDAAALEERCRRQAHRPRHEAVCSKRRHPESESRSDQRHQADRSHDGAR